MNKAIEGLIHSNLGAADLYLKQVLKMQPEHPHALRLMGVLSAQKGDHMLAIEFFKRSLEQLPDNGLVYANLGNVLSELKRYEEALEHHDKAIKLKPDYAEAWSNKGNVLSELKRYEEALEHHDKAIKLKPDYAEAWMNAGIVFALIGIYEKALFCFDNSIGINPKFAAAYFHKSNTLIALKRFEEALGLLDNAIEIEPKYAEAWSNKGIIYIELGRFEEATTQFDGAIKLQPDVATNWSNKGIALNGEKKYQEAITCFERAIEIDGDIDLIRGDLAHTKMHIASWLGVEKILKDLALKIDVNKMASSPFAFLSLIDSPGLQQKCSQSYARVHAVSLNPLPSISKVVNKEKIRIGYFSPDFREHPVSHLLAEFFELHDKEIFEIYAFALGPKDESPLRKRLERAFTQFIDVADQSDIDAAMLSRNINIDIAVDLGGYTHGARPKIFAYRAAPIQINYLGFPGTLGAKDIDYLIADPIVVSEQNRSFFNEKIAFLPNSYLMDDSTRVASDIALNRSDFGLPAEKFIFCCFNNSYKFNPNVTKVWAIILRRVPESVLWIPESNAQFKVNFVDEMSKLGVAPGRIIFAKRVDSMGDHLARCSLADLFLDTGPYNAHTTAIDSLKAGVPVVTLLGEAFQARVAASLLHAINLPETIANTYEEYIEIAVRLATNAEEFKAIKRKLAENKQTAPLFNTVLTTQNIQKVYQEIYRRYINDLQFDDFYLDKI